jgi:hypothetical protein
MRRRIEGSLLSSALLAAIACSTTSPSQPSSSGVGAGPSSALTASVTTPRPVQPANGAQIRNIDQPVTLVVQNALVTTSDTAAYTFEVASDSAFSHKVQTKDGVPQGSGQTSVKLDTLAPASDYYWHARVTGGGTTGSSAPPRSSISGPPS